jgi:hypothetical protein
MFFRRFRRCFICLVLYVTMVAPECLKSRSDVAHGMRVGNSWWRGRRPWWRGRRLGRCRMTSGALPCCARPRPDTSKPVFSLQQFTCAPSFLYFDFLWILFFELELDLQILKLEATYSSRQHYCFIHIMETNGVGSRLGLGIQCAAAVGCAATAWRRRRASRVIDRTTPQQRLKSSVPAPLGWLEVQRFWPNS